MNNKLAVFLLIIFVFPVFAQNTEVSKPSSDDLRLRIELESDSSIVLIGGNISTESQKKEAVKNRIKLYRASKKKNKTIKVKLFVHSKEGNESVRYLIVQNGRVTFIGDYSRDPFGGLRIVTRNCDEVMIGHFVREEPSKDASFKPLKEKKIGKIWPILQCRSGQQMFYL